MKDENNFGLQQLPEKIYEYNGSKLFRNSPVIQN